MMSKEVREEILLDTSVLINFLAVDRIDLFQRHPTLHFLVTDHVREEVTGHSPDQLERLELALSNSSIEVVSVRTPEELGIFGQLLADGPLGIGECSAIAAAIVKGIPLAIDDKRAASRASSMSTALVLHSTESLMVEFIKKDLLTVEAADRIKADWESNHAFRLRFASFKDRL